MLQIKRFLKPLMAVLCLTSLTVNAEFNLDKYRVVLDQKERRTDLRVYNTSEEFISFRVQLLDMAMNEIGEIKPIEDYAYSAKSLVRVSPRMAKNVTPHTYQKFRVRTRGIKEIGEFRTHLLIEELLPPLDGEAKGMIIRPNLRMVIPIFIKNGTVNVDVSATNFAFTATDNTLNFDINRSGNGSAFGNIIIEDSNGEIIYRKHNVGVYRELAQRKFSIELPDTIQTRKGLIFKLLHPDSEEIILQQSI